MVCHDQPLLCGEHFILLLISCDHDLDTLFQIRLSDKLSVLPDRTQRRLIYHVSKFCTGCSGRCSRDGVKVHVVPDLDLSCMYLQDLFPSFQVRKLHRDPPVKSSRAQERRIQSIRTVRGSQDHDALGCIESVHLRQELVQCLLTLVVAAEALAVPLLSDRIDLVDEHDTGRFLICLFEKVADLGRSHSDKHFHKLRA